MALGSVVVGLLVGGISLYALSHGIVQLRRWNRIRAGDPVPIRDAAIDSDPVEVEGRIRPLEEPLSSPLLNQDCVAYEYEIEERRRKRGHDDEDDRRTWETIDSGAAQRPFLLEDETGTAYVDPETASLSMGTERTRSIDAESQLPPGMQSTGTGPLSIDIGGFSLGRRPVRYTEKRLDVGESGYVFGQSDTNPPTRDADIALSDGDETPMFLVSDTGEEGTMRRLLISGVFAILFGVLLLGGGTVAIL